MLPLFPHSVDVHSLIQSSNNVTGPVQGEAEERAFESQPAIDFTVAEWRPVPADEGWAEMHTDLWGLPWDI